MHADFRLQRNRTATVQLRDARLQAAREHDEVGLAVRVLHEGTWGFASGVARGRDAAAALAERAVAVARLGRALAGAPVALAPEPRHADAVWIAPYEIDPFAVPVAERAGRLAELSSRLLAAGVDHVDASLVQVMESTFYADSAGTTTTQQQVRLFPELTAFSVDRAGGGFASQRTLAPPTARGLGVPDRQRLGLGRRDRRAARRCCASTPPRRASRPGRYDLGDRADQPVADDPRVGRARHRARPRARLRGRLRRHQLRDRRPARHAADTAARR